MTFVSFNCGFYMIKGKNQHIVPVGKDWGIKGEGNARYTIILPNKADVQSLGRQIAINQKAELVIHGKNGQIQDKDSYGKDPNPPEDRKH